MTDHDNIPSPDQENEVSRSPEVSSGEEAKEATAEKGKQGKRHLIRPKWLRITLKTLFWIIVGILLIPVLLYVPPVQTLVKNVACNMVAKSTGMNIGIDKFRLKWPVDVSLQGVTVIEASGDTMVRAREAIVDVKLMPLLKLDVKINRLSLLDGYYRMVSPDSSMILKVRAGELTVDDRSSADMANSRILLHQATLKKGNVSLLMDVWKQKSTPSDSTATPFYIAADNLQLEDFGFEMSMLPTIDTLTLTASRLSLLGGVIDLSKNIVTARSLSATGGNVVYLTPTPEYIASHPAPVADSVPTSQSAPMVIKGDSVSLHSFNVLYAVKDAAPLPGFDPSYIQLSDVAVSLKDFYNAASTVELPVTALVGKERSGLQITEGHGTVSVDSTGLALKSLEVMTPYSRLQATAGIPFALMQMEPSAPLNALASGSVGLPDIEAFMPSLSPYTTQLPQRDPLDFKLEASGTLADVSIPVLSASLPGVFSLEAKGKAQNALDIKKLRANLDFDGKISNPSVIDRILGKSMGFKMPSLSLKGHAAAQNENYSANFRLLTSAGDVAADGKVGMNSEAYNAHVSLRNVNVAHFMPTLGVGKVTAKITAHGAGFNPTLPHANTDIKVDVASLVYHKEVLRDIIADVTLRDGAYTLTAISGNSDADFRIDGSGTLAPDLYTFDFSGNLNNLNLQALGMTPDANRGKGELYVMGSASPDKWLYDVDMKLNNFDWTVGNQYFSFPGAVNAKFRSFADNVNARIDASLTSLEFESKSGLKALIDSFTLVGDSVTKQIERRDLDVEGLQHALPPFGLTFNASGRGLLGRYLNTLGFSVDTIYANLDNDSIIHGRMGALQAGNQSMRLDTVGFTLKQRGKLLDYRMHVGNRRNNALAEFADVNLNGYVGGSRALLSLTQKNQKGETGYRIGFTAAMQDSVATVHFTPLKATIAYLPWTFNDDNHVEYNLTNHHIDANLIAQSKQSSIKLMSEIGKSGNDELNVVIDNLRVQDFLKMSVFAPPLTASVNADLNIGYTKEWLYGGGTLGVRDFTYDKIRVGDMDLSVRAGRNNDGTSGAGATLKVDGADALTAKMWLKPDSTGVMEVERFGLELTRFPLYIANAFVGNDVARLSGYLNGDLGMKGTLTAPVLNGSLSCDSVGVYVPMIGARLSFAPDSITVDNNVVNFNNFNIWGANKNPLVIDGQVDATKFSSIKFDIGMNAKNFQLINNNKNARSDLYGKLFLDLSASARGPMEHFNINANVGILSGTDVTYSVPQTTAQLTQQDMEGVVKFVNFNDTTTVHAVDTVAPTMAMRIVADLDIEPGTEVQVIYPGTTTTGSGKGTLHPSGNLSYFQNYMGDMRLNGQLMLGEGSVNYNIPVLGDKKFEFNPQSYVRWSGDVMNPTLNIIASDHIKANLLQNGNSRLVNFLVTLSVLNNLSQPKLLFDLSTDEDMSIQNDLLSMSADQRSMAAINLLLTGQYSQQGVKTASADFLSSSMLTGQLYGILTSQLNTFLANHVKGVDLSFGVDQYDKTVNGETGQAMSYSYQMSKSLFNNRFKISVGGNYTTDASADENFSENLISDISFEYMLKQTSNVTMLVRLFRHTGYESILEGEVTETGVGFAMRRRLSDLRNLFRWNLWRDRNESQKAKATVSASTEETSSREIPDSAAVIKSGAEAVLKNDTLPQTEFDNRENR